MSRTRLQMPRNTDTIPVAAWLPYAVVPCCTVVAMPVALLAHHAWADKPWAAVGLTVAGAGVTGYTWLAGRPRGQMVRATATGVAGAVSVWALGATIGGPLEHPWGDLWALGGLALSAVAIVNRVLRRGGDEVRGGGGGELGEHVRALQDARIAKPKTIGARVVASITAPPGVPFSQIMGSREEVESALDVRPGSVRLIPSPDSARRGRVEVVPVDQLRDVIPWPGPTAPGRSIADAPAELGRVEDGEPLQLWLPGDPTKQRNSTHLAVVGMSGSGKTELLLNLCADVLTRTDAELHVSDSRKADQLPAWLQQHTHRFASGPNAADAYIEELPALIRDRARVLGQAGHKQWVKGCGLPFIVAMFFEAAGVLNGNGTFVDVSESARSVGISLVIELQRATYDRVPTSVRSNIGSWVCLGVKDEDSATAALSDETLDAGAAPWVWKDQRPGYLYAELSGSDRSRWALPGRAYVAGSEIKRAEAIAPWLTAAGTVRPASAGSVALDEADEEEPAEEGNEAWSVADPPDDVDPAQPLLEPDQHARLSFGPPPRRMTPQEARTCLRDYVRALADDGHDLVRPAELADVMEETGRSDSWLYGQLQELCEGPDALLTHAEHGVYGIRTLARV